MNRIVLGKKQYTAPSKWTEMSFRHLVSWNRILQKQIAPTHAVALAVMAFYGIDHFTFRKIGPAQMVQLKETLSFLGEGNRLSSWIVPFLRPGLWKKYHGPNDALSSSTIQEFRLAEIYFMAYRQTRDREYANRLMATLFRPRGESRAQKDCRVQLTELIVSQNARKMRRIKSATCEAIVFNYEGCRQFIFERYPMIFSRSLPGEKTTAIPDLDTIIRTVAGGKFGSFNETNDTPVYRFLDHMASEIEKYEKNRHK